jgi:uncharacterized protein (DUF1015 family)
MATIRPFAALRPQPDRAGRICELPYDVFSEAEARAQAAGNPWSFLHVSRPEVDLPAATDPYTPLVYATGREQFRRLRQEGLLWREPRPAISLYRQVMGNHTQVGFVAVASCAEYRLGVIRKHELTRPDKEDDRVRHLEALGAQTGPAFLVYRNRPELDAILQAGTQDLPDTDFVAPDGVRHTSWTLRDPATLSQVQESFARVETLYIADGHHRTAAAARVAEARRDAGPAAFFLAVIFPHDQVQILAYHRAVRDLWGRTPREFLDALARVVNVEMSPAGRQPGPHQVGLLLESRWHLLSWRPAQREVADAVEALDVSLLQRHVLAPLLGIENPRTSERIGFVGGIRGPEELERLVATGEAACAFALHPTSIEELMDVADRGGLMPPKSTWFEPKLRDGMFCHLLD